VRFEGNDVIEARVFRVTGRVQGVGYRMFVRDAASVEGLSGYVRNLADLSVEALAEGEAEALARFHMALWRGPAGSRVEAVEPTSVPASGRFLGFSIRSSSDVPRG
jgi:acylphosphatase